MSFSCCVCSVQSLNSDILVLCRWTIVAGHIPSDRCVVACSFNAQGGIQDSPAGPRTQTVGRCDAKSGKLGDRCWTEEEDLGARTNALACVFGRVEGQLESQPGMDRCQRQVERRCCVGVEVDARQWFQLSHPSGIQFKDWPGFPM